MIISAPYLFPHCIPLPRVRDYRIELQVIKAVKKADNDFSSPKVNTFSHSGIKSSVTVVTQVNDLLPQGSVKSLELTAFFITFKIELRGSMAGKTYTFDHFFSHYIHLFLYPIRIYNIVIAYKNTAAADESNSSFTAVKMFEIA